MSVRCKLIIDTRERAILVHAQELANVAMHVEQITIGDYAVITPSGSILVTIERKTLEDYAASLKDGRHSNKEKLIALREKTGCKIIYIIEGPLAPKPTDTFARIPYAAIESSIFHLIARDNICLLRSQTSAETASLLARFVRSMDSLCVKHGEPATIVGASDAASVLLHTVHTVNTQDVVSAIWSTLPGITVDNSLAFMARWPLSALLAGTVSLADIGAFISVSGAKMTRIQQKSLTCISKSTQVKMLARVPGLSRASAIALLVGADLYTLVSLERDRLADITLTHTKKTRRLGQVTAAKILELFYYKHTPPAPSVPSVPLLPTPSAPLSPTPLSPTPLLPAPPEIITSPATCDLRAAIASIAAPVFADTEVVDIIV